MREFINLRCEVYKALLRQDLMVEMEKRNISVAERDKHLWFSMWFLASVATFGLAFFPMFYRFVQIRNRHFSRLNELEKRVQNSSKTHVEDKRVELVPMRNAKLWAVSVVLVVPVFVITYLLSVDLKVHEMHEKEFFSRVLGNSDYMLQTVEIRKYVLLTVVTLGIGVIYWLYKIINIYNNHFMFETSLEGRVVEMLEKEGYGETL